MPGLKKYLLSVLLLIVFWAQPAQAADGVVVLHSTPDATTWSQDLLRGLSSVLGDTAEMSQVFLGSSADDDDHFDVQYARLAQAWGDITPLAVVADGELAFAFMRKYREDLFVDAPVIYCGMERPDPGQLQECGNCSGVPAEYAVPETIDFIFAVRPETRMVVGIVDSTDRSRQFRQFAEAAMEPYLDRAQIVFPGHEPGDDNGLDIEAVKSVASSIPRFGAVLFLGFVRDNQGNTVDEAAIVRMVSTQSPAPVFVLSDQWLTGSYGPLAGGVVVSPAAQGRTVGRMIESARRGAAVQEMLPESEPAYPVADLTVLARFGIDRDGLPRGVRLIHVPPKPTEVEGVASTDMVIIGVGCALLIGLFFVYRRFRRSN